MPKAVLVTGATGFIGRHLVRSLVNAGLKVIALIRDRELPEDLKVAVGVIKRDEDGSALKQAVTKVDAVCHLAAFIPPDYENPAFAEKCYRDNALLTLHLAEIVTQRPGTKFIYLSTGQSYAFSLSPVSEAALLYPSSRATYYLASKLAGELYVEHLRHSRGLSAFVFRVGCCYGPGMSENSVISKFLKAAAMGLPLQLYNNGLPACDYVYVADVVSLIVKALSRGEPGIYNAASGRSYSVKELASEIGDVFFDGKITTELQPPKNHVPSSFPALAIDKAARMWGYKPHPLREGLEKYRMEFEQTPTQPTPLL